MVNHKFSLNLTLHITSHEDSQFGGSEAREKLEKSLTSKLDIRMGILVLIYILNCKYMTPILVLNDDHPQDIDRNNAAYTMPP